VNLELQDIGVLVPKDVLLELLHSALIAPLLEADCSRLWAEELIGTDASPAYGVGVSALAVDGAKVKGLGRW